jgi:hypothetical protein
MATKGKRFIGHLSSMFLVDKVLLIADKTVT